MILHLSQIFFTDARTFIVVRSSVQQFYDPASSPVVRRNRHYHPVARPEPDKVTFRGAGHVGQHPILVREPQLYGRVRKEFNHFRLKLFYGRVNTHGPFAVTATTCSK